MMVRIFAGIIALILAAPVLANSSHDADRFTIVPVKYTGTITATPTEGSEITLYNNNSGETVPYTGPLPDYPYKVGDTITISFDAVVPSISAIESGLIPPSADGIYQFRLGSPDKLAYASGNINNLDASGPIGPLIGDLNRPVVNSDGSLAIVYNANTGHYSINVNYDEEPLDEASFSIGSFDAPILVYTDEDGFIRLGNRSDFTRTGELENWVGTAETGLIQTFSVSVPPSVGRPDFTLRNTSNVTFDGAFNLPIYAGPGISTAVPAPPALLLFGLGAGALFWRRKSNFGRK